MTPEFRFTQKQEEALTLMGTRAQHIMLFGGGRSGKTFLICRAIAARAIKAPNSRHAVLRFRFNHVKQSIVLDTWPKMMRLCYPGMHVHLDKTDWFAQFPNGSQVWFGGLDEKERTEKILGMEFITIFLNECSQISQAARDLMITRLAQACNQEIDGLPTVPLIPRMYYDENPPNKGHWTYKLFIRKLNLDTREALADPENYVSMLMNPKDNMENLTESYLVGLEALGAKMRARFLDGKFAEITQNALFDTMSIDKWRTVNMNELPEMIRIVVSVDPSGSGDVENETNDEIGIIVAGLGTDGIGYLLADLTCKCGPATWGRIATDTFDRWKANIIVAEQNFGGAMVERVIQVSRPRTPYKAVTASRGKAVRAEPVAALYDQGRIRHAGYFPELEEELENFTTNGYIGENSPNRADATVWAFTELFGQIVQVKQKPKHQAVRYEPLDVGVGY